MSRPTVLELLRLATGYLREKGVAQPRLDAEVLLGHALQMERIMLYVHHDRPLEPHEVDVYRTLIARRGRREPVAYLMGEKEFFGRSFQVDPRVLIPRPETEHLVEVALAFAIGEGPVRGWDVGTGSGILAVTLAAELPDSHWLATDLSADALAVARANAERHGVADRIRFLEGDLWAGTKPDGSWDLIVSNPPYLTDHEMAHLAPEIRYEPRQALAGGPDGLQVIRRLVQQAWAFLRPGGLLAFEIGAGQAEACRQLLAEAGQYEGIRVLPDHAGHPRVVCGLRTSP
ncbi:peptide chain release factor N(5)-glutamine methyltransferase [Limnochorda sp.]|mgnify:FL=1|uniref:peptide chain release factor N(5)-glutamine methyltransferase n=1 Tax=Limnochorda sp. TaxID=1940279 RepID=UPI0018238982|nr:peptide chain release factor N(5)-glutamine methyltransferase [Bacillota bacterium]MBO2519266.1 peptide chain release factor N(5)-glutamine methyltransferase [Bacillota bacterium]NMA71454.1 peptide chain release factor N(5)-glutamine methyltransferase [Bacillota bacterium]